MPCRHHAVLLSAMLDQRQTNTGPNVSCLLEMERIGKGAQIVAVNWLIILTVHISCMRRENTVFKNRDLGNKESICQFTMWFNVGLESQKAESALLKS